MAQLMDGKALSQIVWEETRAAAEAFESEKSRKPVLAVLLVGEDPASKIYVRNKARACKACGIESRVMRLPEDTDEETLLGIIRDLNADPSVDGVMTQLPLPKGLDEGRILAEIDPDKDVDGLHTVNLGRLAAGETGFVPCTPQGVMRLLSHYGVDCTGKHAVVVGRSNIVGKPMALLLLAANATVTVCHSRTKDLESYVRDADILVAAIGRPEFIRGEWLKPGCVVIDVGINRTDDGLKGDVDAQGAEEKASLRTPVPGGVGPMTVAMLMHNTMEAARRHG